MTLSRQEIEDDIHLYYSSVVDNPQDKVKLIANAQSVVIERDFGQS